MTQIKIASWNVNSINARLENLLFWLCETKPDVVLLQEIKCEENNFPLQPITDLGYNVAVFGQKSYNGVAILSKFPLQDIVKNLDPDDPQSRYIEAVINVENQAIRVASIYVPNGGAELLVNQKVNESDKFLYKMKFFDRLKNHLHSLLKHNEIAVFGGDYNVAANDVDVYDPKSLKDTVCFHSDEQKKFRQILNLGYLDSFRIIHPTTQNFSWWDYRGNCWGYNKGMRIDYLLTSPKAADLLTSAFMDDKMMMEKTKPSDHCPVIITLELKS
ncbi:MAG: exodeoxyribonuclease III [Pseudomonadota bacterium]